ncbi:Acyltransferase family protein [Rosistilla ulvae]|uniref:Acyltransferase family protein n=2 Tax=Rosistilla ulvae TaxID=1930277 RepID=A0A517M0I7_9BACT|nr:Acyltransferase family protein [Rosistilla ulvae]
MQLDALRGLAAVAVVVYHYTVFAPMSGVQAAGFHDGKYGVHLFFMISGFVILMSASRQSSSTRFLWGRFARLYPAYWVALLLSVAAVLVSGLVPERPLSLGVVIANVTMLQTAWDVPNVNSSFWTLYIELLFYLCVALTLAIRRIQWLPWAMAAVVLFDTLAVFPQAWDRVPGWWKLPLYFPLLRHLYLFTFGVWVYQARTRWSAMLPVVAMLCLLNAYGRGVELYPLAIIASLGLVLYAASSGWLVWLENRWLIWLGTISYSLYLVHENVGYAIVRTATKHGWPLWSGQWLAALVSVLVAVVVTYSVEKPAHRILRRWGASHNHSDEVFTSMVEQRNAKRVVL